MKTKNYKQLLPRRYTSTFMLDFSCFSIMNCNIFAQSYKVSSISWGLSTYSLCKQEFTSHLTSPHLLCLQSLHCLSLCLHCPLTQLPLLSLTLSTWPWLLTLVSLLFPPSCSKPNPALLPCWSPLSSAPSTSLSTLTLTNTNKNNFPLPLELWEFTCPTYIKSK